MKWLSFWIVCFKSAKHFLPAFRQGPACLPAFHLAPSSPECHHHATTGVQMILSSWREAAGAVAVSWFAGLVGSLNLSPFLLDLIPAHYSHQKGCEVVFRTVVIENIDGWLYKLASQSSLIAFVLIFVEQKEVLFRQLYSLSPCRPSESIPLYCELGEPWPTLKVHFLSKSLSTAGKWGELGFCNLTQVGRRPNSHSFWTNEA